MPAASGMSPIFASGGLDEDSIAAMVAAGAPVDGFGVGTSLATSSDVPALDCAYKLEEYAGLARRKRSTGKATWAGRKQVWRRYDPDGRMSGDVMSIESDQQAGEPLLEPVMRSGRRIVPHPMLADSRAHAARDLARLPDALHRLARGSVYPVEVTATLAEPPPGSIAGSPTPRRATRRGGNRHERAREPRAIAIYC